VSANTEQRKLAAIMFTDMVGYSALSQRSEALALEMLEEHRRVVRGILPRHGGREVKTTGDGFLLEFPSALAAVQGAVEIQNAFHERNQTSPPERQLRLRIGIHVGDVVMREGDIHGDGVNIAARLEPLARRAEFVFPTRSTTRCATNWSKLSPASGLRNSKTSNCRSQCIAW